MAALALRVLTVTGLLLVSLAVRPKFTDLDPDEPLNDDRAQCLRQDNLDIVGGHDANTKYILRAAYSPYPMNPQKDVYFLCENLQIKAIKAEVKIRRVESNEFEFELSGPHKTTPDPESKTAGAAIFVISGFEVATGILMADWAADFAADRKLLREGQTGTLWFAITGRMRAVKKRGVWETELVAGSEKVDFFDVKLQGQWVIDRALRSWGRLKEVVLTQLYEVLKAAVPVNLLASFQYLPFIPGFRDSSQDFWVEAYLDIQAEAHERNYGDIALLARGHVKAYVKPTALLDVLVHEFNVTQMAQDAVESFFQDPQIRRDFAQNRETFVENLHQYRFVSDSLMKLVTEARHLDELMPLLLREAEERAKDFLLRFLDPLLKAHASGKSRVFTNLKAGLQADGVWGPGPGGNGSRSFKWDILPFSDVDSLKDSTFIKMDRNLLAVFGLRENLLEPVGNAENCSIVVKDLHLNRSSLRLASGAVRNCRRSAENKSAISWEAHDVEFSDFLLRLPAMFEQSLEVSGAELGTEFRSDGQVLLKSGDGPTRGTRIVLKKTWEREGTKATSPGRNRPKDQDRLDGAVPEYFKRPSEANAEGEKLLLDRFRRGSASISTRMHGDGHHDGTIAFSFSALQTSLVNLQSAFGDLLAPRARQDFGYIFAADLFQHYKGFDKKSKLAMAVLHCGFLRIFHWPLRDHASERLSFHYLSDIDIVSAEMEEGSNVTMAGQQRKCLRLSTDETSSSWFWKQRKRRVAHFLCSTAEAVAIMTAAINLQKLRFRDPRAVEWNYGSHDAGKEQYLLQDGQVQRNLLQVMQDVARQSHSRAALVEVHQAMPAVPASPVAAQSSVLEESVEAETKQPPLPTRPDSPESLECRAEEMLDVHWPPERYGDAVLRKSFPTKGALGNVDVIIKHLELVNMDLRGMLRRSEDTTFSLMLGGPARGRAIVQMFVDGIEFSSSKSNMMGLVHTVSAMDRIFRPTQNVARMLPTEGLHRGPLFVKFKMMVHFHRKDGRWDVKPGALSDVDIKFGNGGAVEHMINTLLGIFGGVDQLLLETLWPMVATYIPENIVETLERVAAKDGQMAHHFKITGRCQQRMGERCGSSKVDFSIKDLTNVDVATSKVFPMYLSKLSPEKSAIEESVALTLLDSYVACVSELKQVDKGAEAGPLKGMLGQATVNLAMETNSRAQVNVSTQAVAPVQMLRCFLGDALLNGLLSDQKSSMKGAAKVQGKNLNISKVRLQSLRVPIRNKGKEEAFELSVSLDKANIVLNESGPVFEKALGHVDLELDAAEGLVLKELADGYPLLSMDVPEKLLESLFRYLSEMWAQPRNVRTAPEYLPHGRLPEQFRRPRSVIGTSLMFQQLLVNGHTSVGVRFSEREPLEEDGKAAQEHLSAQVSVLLHATLDMKPTFWRAVLNRKQHDYGFVFLSTVGAWGAASDGLPRQAAVLQISCGQVQIFELSGSGPYDHVLYSKSIHDIFMKSASDTPSFQNIGEKTCWNLKITIHAYFVHTTKVFRFCAAVQAMDAVQQALHLQLTRLGSIHEAIREEKAADEESTRLTGVRFTGERPQVFGDSTWFRRYNAFDTTSWSPEIPADFVKIETPLKRWEEARKQT